LKTALKIAGAVVGVLVVGIAIAGLLLPDSTLRGVTGPLGDKAVNVKHAVNGTISQTVDDTIFGIKSLWWDVSGGAAFDSNTRVVVELPKSLREQLGTGSEQPASDAGASTALKSEAQEAPMAHAAPAPPPEPTPEPKPEPKPAHVATMAPTTEHKAEPAHEPAAKPMETHAPSPEAPKTATHSEPKPDAMKEPPKQPVAMSAASAPPPPPPAPTPEPKAAPKPEPKAAPKQVAKAAPEPAPAPKPMPVAPVQTDDGTSEHKQGLAYYKGDGVQKDFRTAAEWFNKAAAKGHAAAKYNLGIMAYTGQGMNKDMSTAARWFQGAAEQGYAPAQYNLGFMYYNGTGVKKDDLQAYTWMDRAANQGYEKAVKARDLLAKALPKEIFQSQ